MLHLLLLLSHPAAPRPGSPQEGSTNRFGDQMATYLPGVAFGPPIIHVNLPDTLKPLPLKAVKAEVRVSGRRWPIVGSRLAPEAHMWSGSL